ncbi:hypothetical protein D3C80_1299250 [compost metagenome]
MSQPHDAADIFYLLLPVRIAPHQGGGQLGQLGAGLGLMQPLGQALQQQPQGGQVLGGAAGQQPLDIGVFDRLDAPAQAFIELGELLGEAGLLQPQLLLEILRQLVLVHPVQAPIGQPQHGKVLQGAEPVQLLHQSGVVRRGGYAWRREVHDGGDDRQQRHGVVRCGGLDRHAKLPKMLTFKGSRK